MKGHLFPVISITKSVPNQLEFICIRIKKSNYGLGTMLFITANKKLLFELLEEINLVL